MLCLTKLQNHSFINCNAILIIKSLFLRILNIFELSISLIYNI